MSSRKGSINGTKAPYMRLENWLNGSLAFWRDKHPGSLWGYNVEMYEARLKEAVKHHKNISTLD